MNVPMYDIAERLGFTAVATEPLHQEGDSRLVFNIL
jgi:hypothetical protein